MPQMLSELKKLSSPERKEANAWFFKTGKGEYGEGDVFLGVNVPDTRFVAKKFLSLPLPQLEAHLCSKYHEERLCALLVLAEKFRKGDGKTQKEIFNFYLSNAKRVNNWDLVDLSAPKICGEYLADKDRGVLCKLAESKNLWERRIAVVSTFAFIKRDELKDTFEISKTLLEDRHDLIHKACGWMLREAGKKDKKALVAFLEEYGGRMPRTMLRYAIEKFPEGERKKFLEK